MSTLSPMQQSHDKQVAKYAGILEAAFELFLERGVDEVSVQEITDRAGVAKGTFYIYFRDKEELRECLVTQKSHTLFQRALRVMHQAQIENFEDQIIFVIDFIIDTLAERPAFLRLITKDLSFGVFNRKVNGLFADSQDNILRAMLSGAKKNGIRLRDPRILLFMIIELSSSTCFSCILEHEPMDIAEFKPHLFAAIRELIQAAIIPEADGDEATPGLH